MEGGGWREEGGREGQAEESLPSDQVRLEVETRAVAARPDWEGHFSILSIGHSQVWDIFCQYEGQLVIPTDNNDRALTRMGLWRRVIFVNCHLISSLASLSSDIPLRLTSISSKSRCLYFVLRKMIDP